MSRVQLALNVDDLETAVAFYSKLFNTQPAKLRPGYANFAIADPPLKLVLFEGQGAPATLNHLGVEVETAEEVAEAHRRLADVGLVTVTEDEVACCYALQDKVWVDAPDGTRGRSTRCSTTSRCSRMRVLAVAREPLPMKAATWRRGFAEFVGTALLLIAVIGSGIAAHRLSPHDTGIQLLENAIATGAALVAIILALHAVSGAHLNPVVTLADARSAASTTEPPRCTSGRRSPAPQAARCWRT